MRKKRNLSNTFVFGCKNVTSVCIYIFKINRFSPKTILFSFVAYFINQMFIMFVAFFFDEDLTLE